MVLVMVWYMERTDWFDWYFTRLTRESCGLVFCRPWERCLYGRCSCKPPSMCPTENVTEVCDRNNRKFRSFCQVMQELNLNLLRVNKTKVCFILNLNKYFVNVDIFNAEAISFPADGTLVFHKEACVFPLWGNVYRSDISKALKFSRFLCATVRLQCDDNICLFMKTSHSNTSNVQHLNISGHGSSTSLCTKYWQWERDVGLLEKVEHGCC